MGWAFIKSLVWDLFSLMSQQKSHVEVLGGQLMKEDPSWEKLVLQEKFRSHLQRGEIGAAGLDEFAIGRDGQGKREPGGEMLNVSAIHFLKLPRLKEASKIDRRMVKEVEEGKRSRN